MVLLGVFTVAAHGAVSDELDPQADFRLPTVVNAPGTWSAAENALGPVAAVGVATRTEADGLFEDRQSLSYFATSAIDGSSTWLDLPGLDPDRGGLVAQVALSPDGRWIGWARTGKRYASGWSIRDTMTGQIRSLDVAGHARVRLSMTDLAFSGDSRYLLTSFAVPGESARGRRDHQFVAWDVEDGTPTVLEEPGFFWLPNLGYSDEGVVWSRGHEVYRVDPATSTREVATLPYEVLLASWAPRDAAFAYIGRNGRRQDQLYVGAGPSTALRAVELPGTSPIGETLTWRDATHVVVGNYRRAVYVVDITDGTHETISLRGSGDQFNPPLLATDLWANPLREPADPIGTSDPRGSWRWVGLVLFIALLGLGIALLRRAGRAEEAGDDQEQVVPRAAWWLAGLFLAGEVAAFLLPGVGGAGHVLLSMVLTAVIVTWVADGVLRARILRFGFVWVLLSASVSLGFVGIAAGEIEMFGADAVAFVFTVAQLVALGALSTTSYFERCRRSPAGARAGRALVAPLLVIAFLTGLLGGLMGPNDESAMSVNLEINL